MLHIILLILKIIGIVILALLGFLLGVLLLILFIPIRYVIEGEKKAELTLHGRVSWLLRILCVKFQYIGNEFQYKVKVFGVTILDSLKPRVKKIKQKKKRKVKKKKVTRKGILTKSREKQILDTDEKELKKEKIKEKELERKKLIDTEVKNEELQIDKSDNAKQQIADTHNVLENEKVKLKEKQISETKSCDKGNSEIRIKEELIKKEQISKEQRAEKIQDKITKEDKIEEIQIDEPQINKTESTETETKETETKEAETKETETTETTETETIEAKTTESKSDEKQPSEPAESIDNPVGEEQENENPKGIWNKIMGFFHKIKAGFQKLKDLYLKIKDTLVNWKDKLSNIGEIKDKILEFIRDVENKAGINSVFLNLGKVLKHIKPRIFKFYIEFGTGDPCTTGQALGVLGILYSIYGEYVQIVPNFTEAKYEGVLYARGRIRLFTLLIICIKLIRDKKFKYLVERMKKIKEEL